MNPYLLDKFVAVRRQEFEKDAAANRLARQVRPARTPDRGQPGRMRLWTVRLRRPRLFPTS
jgi:hypothetical protein